MAYGYLIKDGFGQVELNQVAFRRDGRIEAQCALDSTDFNGRTAFAENGMILVVDKKAEKIRLPKADDTNVTYALNYSTEHLYDERALGLKNFRLGPDDFYPRVGFLSVGDRFTTNAVRYTVGSSAGQYADEAAIRTAMGSGRVYGIPSVEGYIELTNDPDDSTLVLEAVKFTTMPDGQPAIKFYVIKA